MTHRRLTIDEIETLAFDALSVSGAAARAARPLAKAVAAAEAEGIASHGLAYVPVYCEHLACGKVDGSAVPRVMNPGPATIAVDAGTGFAHPAIDLGFEQLVPLAREMGIDEVHANVSPEDKHQKVEALKTDGRRVAMAGDGINDAPALAGAHVGIAMGSGTDIAIESADIIILGTRLGLIRVAREVSRHSYRKMVQNILLAFTFNGIGIPVAATGLIDPLWAMLAMAVSVTAIFINSLWGRPSLFIDAVLSVGRQDRAAA